MTAVLYGGRRSPGWAVLDKFNFSFRPSARRFESWTQPGGCLPRVKAGIVAGIAGFALGAAISRGIRKF